MSDTETKQIVGVCEEISEKNGWTAFAINVGSQYPVRLSTKLPALIEQGRAVGQQQAVWTFKESQGGENPNKPGTFYTNRYFDGVTTDMEAHDSVAANNTPSRNAPAAQTHAPLPAGDKDRAITRMAVLKVAATIVAAGYGSPATDPNGESDAGTDTIALAARFETWVYRDTDDIPFG